MWKFRMAREEDAEELGRVAAEIFHDTFAPFNTPEDMALYSSQAFTTEALAAEIREPLAYVTLAIDEGRIIGYAQLHRGDAPAFITGGNPIELKRFYILGKWHGTGLAQALMNEVIARSREQGAGTIWLGVWERNGRAISFYRKYGFHETGEQSFLLGNDLQRDVVMVKELEPGS